MKKTASFMLALLMLVSIIPIGAIHSLAVTSSDGLYKYTIISDVAKTAEIIPHILMTGDITIPSTIDGYTVTSIGDYTFQMFPITSVIFPDTVTSIGCFAFGDCSLTSLTIGAGVKSIGESSFSGNKSLKSVTIPSSVTSIGPKAFKFCGSLASVTIPDSVTSIGESAFTECANLKSVAIGANVTSIGDMAFYGCRGLTSVTIPSSATNFGQYIFGECLNLTSVTISNGVKSIGIGSFVTCYGLTSIIIPDTVTSIGADAFLGCTGLTSVTIPSSVTSIGPKAFGYDPQGNKVSGFTINGLAGSAAEAYAKANGFPFYTPGGDVLVKTTLNGTSMPATGTYSVEIPADLSIVWGTTAATDVSYKVTSHLALGATLDISIASANTNLLKESKNKYSIPYTFAQFNKKTFNEINSNASSGSTITVADANWKAVPIAEYSDTLTYSVTYVKGI